MPGKEEDAEMQNMLRIVGSLFHVGRLYTSMCETGSATIRRDNSVESVYLWTTSKKKKENDGTKPKQVTSE